MLHLTWHSYMSMLSSMVNKEILRSNQKYCTSVRWYQIRFQLNNKLFFCFASNLLLISLKLFTKNNTPLRWYMKLLSKLKVIDILTAKNITAWMHLLHWRPLQTKAWGKDIWFSSTHNSAHICMKSSTYLYW